MKIYFPNKNITVIDLFSAPLQEKILRTWDDLQIKGYIFIIIITIIRMFNPRTGFSEQTQAPRLQFWPKAGLPPQTQERRLKFY